MYLGKHCLAFLAGKNDIFSHQTRFMGSKYTTNAFAAEPWHAVLVFLELRGTYVSGGCECPAIFAKGNLIHKANVVVSECRPIVCYRVVAY